MANSVVVAAAGGDGPDPNREFWIGMRNTYIQQIRLIRARFGPSLQGDDGVLAAGVMTSLMNAVTAVERRYGLRAWVEG